MAKLNEQSIKIKISELLKDDEPNNVIIDNETVEQLVAVLQELVGDRRLIEIIRD
jgi:hypothetical protein